MSVFFSANHSTLLSGSGHVPTLSEVTHGTTSAFREKSCSDTTDSWSSWHHSFFFFFLLSFTCLFTLHQWATPVGLHHKADREHHCSPPALANLVHSHHEAVFALIAFVITYKNLCPSVLSSLFFYCFLFQCWSPQITLSTQWPIKMWPINSSMWSIGKIHFKSLNLVI